MTYEPTHYSASDGSEATLIEVLPDGMHFRLRNENGDEWVDHLDEWLPIDEPAEESF